MTLTGKIAKRDDDKFLLFGFAAAADVVDSQGDTIPIDELEKAAYKFVRHGGYGSAMHTGAPVADLIESLFITVDKAELLNLNKDLIGKWFVGFHVTDTATWQAIKNGDFQAFSIGGRAVREAVADDGET